MTKMMTEKGSLEYGIEYDGKLHFDFEVRLPVIKDNREALIATHAEFGTTDGANANLYYKIGVFASCLISLGTIPADAINTELLDQQLTDVDLDVLDNAISCIKKKRKQLKVASPTTDNVSCCLASTVSASSE